MERHPYRLGLTGSIGMGKSTTAGMFAREGVPVWDADACVHRLYGVGGSGVSAVGGLVPDAIVGDQVDREKLREAMAADPSLLARIEAAVHPLVAADREGFVEAHADSPVLLFDIPLLFEIGAETALDGIVVVTASEAVQRARVLERPGMTEAHLQRILARQMPDTEKRARADFVVRTDLGIEAAQTEIRSILRKIVNREKETARA